MINAMNKSKQSDSPSLGEGGERLSLLELNALVRRSLEQCLPDEYWIQAELSDVRFQYDRALLSGIRAERSSQQQSRSQGTRYDLE